MPSVHSLAITSSEPNICGAVIALGFIRARGAAGRPSAAAAGRRVHASSARMQHLDDRDLPTPDGPTSMSEWRTSDISYSWITLARHAVERCRLSSGSLRERPPRAPCAPCFSALRPGKRSSISERKSGTSSATNLERFMSRSVRISSSASRVERVALRRARGAQHGEDVAQAEVVVRLLRELLLAQPVEHVELLREQRVVLVARAVSLTFMMIWRSGTIIVTPRKSDLRFSGSSCRPA